MHMEIRLGIGQENRHGLRQAESDHRQSMMPGRWRQLHRFEGPVHGRADIMLTVDQGSVAIEQRKAIGRSEEHTSELQSLMRISYAAFCLKKNTDALCLEQRIAILAVETRACVDSDGEPVGRRVEL